MHVVHRQFVLDLKSTSISHSNTDQALHFIITFLLETLLRPHPHTILVLSLTDLPMLICFPSPNCVQCQHLMSVRPGSFIVVFRSLQVLLFSPLPKPKILMIGKKPSHTSLTNTKPSCFFATALRQTRNEMSYA